MGTIQRVMKYSGLNYNETLNLPVDTFKMMVKESVIDEMSRTKEGKRILENYHCYKKTQLDNSDILELKQLIV